GRSRGEAGAPGPIGGPTPRAGKDGGRPASVRLDLTAPRLRVQGIPAERLAGSVDYRKGDIVYNLQGETLGGRFRLDGTYPLREIRRGGPEKKGGGAANGGGAAGGPGAPAPGAAGAAGGARAAAAAGAAPHGTPRP